jgi:hypothetical protein
MFRSLVKSARLIENEALGSLKVAAAALETSAQHAQDTCMLLAIIYDNTWST